MDFSKEQIKKSAVLLPTLGAGFEYIAAAVMNSANHNSSISKYVDAVFYQMFAPIENIQNALSNQAFMDYQPLILGAAALLATKGIWESKHQYEDASDYGAYGTARWAYANEIFNPDNITSDMKKEGTILGKHKGKPINQHTKSRLNRNMLVVGGSGAGKTRSLIIPNILKNTEKSIVVIDPKGELYEKTSELKRQQGYEVHLVNFKNREISDRYNLFEYLRRDADAFKIADRMSTNAAEGSHVKKDFWNMASTSLLQALILYVKYALPKEQQHMGSVLALGQVPEEELKALFEEFDRGHIVRKAYETAYAKLKDKTFSDVFMTLMQTLNPWQYDEVSQFTATNDFLFEDIGKQKMIVYVMIPIADNEFLPLITTFFEQMFTELYSLADKNFGELPRGVLLFLDEFANIGKIPNFHKRLSTTRSLGIEVSVVLQDTSQLENVYGKELAKEIINNCDIRLLLKANEFETAKYFSQLCGKTTIQITNSSRSKGSKSSTKSESVSYVSRDLITPDEILRLKPDEELLFLSNSYPMRVEKAWFDKIKEFKNVLNNKVSRDSYPVPDRSDYNVFVYVPKEKPEEDFDEEIKVDMETGEILNDAPKEKDSDQEKSEPEEENELDDLLSNFKF